MSHCAHESQRPLRPRWWEDYRCGCVSEVVDRKKDLPGYCGQHGESRRSVWPDYMSRTRHQQEER